MLDDELKSRKQAAMDEASREIEENFSNFLAQSVVKTAYEKQGIKSSRFQSLVKTLWWLMGWSFTLPLAQKLSLKPPKTSSSPRRVCH